MPRSLSMFSQSGSASEFRRASCSSHSRCVSSHAQPRTSVRARGTRYTFKTRTCYHAVSHTHTELFALRARVLCQSVGELSEQPPPKIPTSPFINHRHQHNSSSHTCLPHPVSVCPSSSHFSQKDSILKKQQLR